MSSLHSIPRPATAGAAATDVVFVHGLGGRPFETWQHDTKQPQNSWPYWLAADVPHAAVHCLEYEAEASKWLGRSMSLVDRATNVLTLFTTKAIGARPVVFVCHSLGGLLVKQMLRQTQDQSEPAWRAIAEQTRAVVFVATPHGGSDLATWLHRLGTLLRASPSIDDLQSHSPWLRDLNAWYRANAGRLGIDTHCFSETATTNGVMVVDAGSVDPGMTGVVHCPLDADHVGICKPDSRNHMLYEYVLQLVRNSPAIRPVGPLAESTARRFAPGIRPLRGLPADLPDFEGRSGELDTILGKTPDGQLPAVVAIVGMGGVGKSALAIRAAHLLADDVPHACVYVDLEGSSERPLGALDAMSRVIAAFEPGTRLPTEESAVIEAFGKALDDQRVLLVLDNARDARSVAPLVENRPARCRMIVTARERIALSRVTHVPLDGLTDEEAQRLLRTLVDPGRADDETIAKVAARCGGLPLALRVAGSFLERHPDYPVDMYLRALSDESQRLAKLRVKGLPKLDVAAVLAVSARQLREDDAELAERWQMLSIFPTDFDRAAAAAVWSVQEDEAQDGLSELAARSMVRFDPARFRYRLHDLMRDVAVGSAAAPTVEEAAERHARHFMRMTIDAFKSLEAFMEAALLREREKRNIDAAVAWSAAHVASSEQSARLAADYATSNAALFDPLDRKELSRQLDACRTLGDRRSEGHVLFVMARAQRRVGLSDEVIRRDDECLAIAREIGDRRLERDALRHLGLSYFDRGDFRRAMEYGEQGLALARALGERRDEAAVLGSLGDAYYELGTLEAAIASQEQRVAIAREIGDTHDEAAALAALGRACCDLGEPRRARAHYDRCLAIARPVEEREIRSASLRGLGRVWRALGDLPRAVRYYEQYIDSVRELEPYDDAWDAGHPLGELGLIWAALGEPQRALEYHERHVETAREASDRDSEGAALFNAAELHQQLGEHERAVEKAEEAFWVFYESSHHRDGAAGKAKERAEIVRAKLVEWGKDVWGA